MVNTLRIKRRAAGGAAGPPASLAAAELAFNEQDNTLYYGKGNSAGVATSIISIGGQGFLTGTPAALTAVSETNITLTLAGTPATALLQATSITVGWTGTLANARLANMNGHTYKGNNTASAAPPIDVTNTQLTADLNLFSSTLQGLVPSSGGGTTNFLRADGTWSAPAGGGTVTTTGSPASGQWAQFSGVTSITGIATASAPWTRYDTNQGLTTPQQGVALRNIGAAQLNLVNGKLVESHASNAATFAIKTLAGADPSATDPVTVFFQNGTSLAITAALSLTLASGCTLGTISAWSFRLWFAIASNAGTPQLIVRNCCYYTATLVPAVSATPSAAASVAGFDPKGLETAAAILSPGVAQTSYASSAFTSQPARIIGFADYEGGLTTAGTWAASPTRIVLSSPSSPIPGDVVQTVSQNVSTTGAGTVSTTFIWSALQLNVTPKSPCNPIQYSVGTDSSTQCTNATGFSSLVRISRTPVAGTPITDLSGSVYLAYSVNSAVLNGSFCSSVLDYHHATTGYPLTYGLRIAVDTAGGAGGFYLPYDYAWA